MVAKGVSPPTLGSWLLICLSETKSAAYLAALLAFWGTCVVRCHTPLGCSASHPQGHYGRDSAWFFGLRLAAPSNLLTCPGIFQKARLHSPEGNNLA